MSPSQTQRTLSPGSPPIAQPSKSNRAQYVVVSPVRNEEKYLRETIGSMVAQTHLPAEWVIVDDGSTDQTWAILQEASRHHPWIVPTKRPDRGFRHSGAGVVEAFYDGFDIISKKDWGYVVKLDGDLSFGPSYFADCLKRFETNPRLGIGGGLICAFRNGGLEPESKYDPKFHVRGATKIYRRDCWQAIGGLLRAPGWDGMDEIQANMLGWTTTTFSDLKVRHYRPAGEATGRWKDWVKGGRGNYIAGYHPLFMIGKSFKRLGSKPYGLATFGLLVGYFGGWIKRMDRIPNRDAIAYIRKQQINRLLGRESLWSE